MYFPHFTTVIKMRHNKRAVQNIMHNYLTLFVMDTIDNYFSFEDCIWFGLVIATDKNKNNKINNLFIKYLNVINLVN